MRSLLFALLATVPSQNSLDGIELLNDYIQARFANPLPASLGMSRIVRPSSFGVHFAPLRNASRDFVPETKAEFQLLSILEDGHVEVGFYLAGRATAGPRSLKGPGVISRGTDRATLPDLETMRDLGRKALDRSFETKLGPWTVVARPVLAEQERCLACHHGARLHDTLGAALYAYRQ